MANDLTIKQEKFCRKYIELGNATEAYRQSYDCENMNDDSIRVEGYRLLENPHIALQIDKHRERANKKLEVTVETLSQEYDDIRILATASEQYSPAVSAITGKAKLHGLIIDKATTTTKLTYEDMTDEQLVALARSKGIDISRYTNLPSSGKEEVAE